MHILTKLEWDSDFFNLNVAKVEGDIRNRNDLLQVEELIRENNTDIAYYTNSQELPTHVLDSNEIEFVLVDKKITYSKLITPGLDIENGIVSVNSDRADDKLKKLAVQSGVFSRFNVDKRIPKRKFEELYELWVINSLNRKIAQEVLVYKENDNICGLITLGEKNSRADIGIIAVDISSRGKGIGKLLMSSAEKWAENIGYDSIQVVTQERNIPACRLYEKCEYTIEQMEFFYHIWKK